MPDGCYSVSFWTRDDPKLKGNNGRHLCLVLSPANIDQVEAWIKRAKKEMREKRREIKKTEREVVRLLKAERELSNCEVAQRLWADSSLRYIKEHEVARPRDKLKQKLRLVG